VEVFGAVDRVPEDPVRRAPERPIRVAWGRRRNVKDLLIPIFRFRPVGR